jgi:hypothetical protein
MAVESPALNSLTVFLRRNVLTLTLTVIGVFGVGWWLSNIEGRITKVEHNQTIEREVTRFNCIEHPQGHLCLVGVRRAIARCLEDTRCSALLASAPAAHHSLREAGVPRHPTGHPPHGPPETSPAPVAHEGHHGTTHHHGHSPPAPPHHGHGHGGGGHSGGHRHHPGPPPVPEPSTPAPAPAPTPGNAPEGKGGEVCVRNPALPACVHAGSNGVGAEVGGVGVEVGTSGE